MDLSQALLLLMITSMFVLWASVKWDIPVLAIVNRWFRWVLFSLLTAYIVKELDWSNRHFLVIAATTFLSWFLIETLYTWLGIRVLNYSTASLFPRFKKNPHQSEWPNTPKFIKLRNWLRSNKFASNQALIAEIFDTVFVHSSIYLDEAQTSRLQIIFIPQRNGRFIEYYIFTSLSETGNYYITDNVQMPFGGFYPENWNPLRRPLSRSVDNLYKTHKRRLKESGEVFHTWDGDLCEEANREQHILERFNTMEGFLMPSHLQGEHGKISLDGRYRIWKELWMLKYFGYSPKAQY